MRRFTRGIKIILVASLWFCAMLFGLWAHYYLKPVVPKEYETLSEIIQYAKTLPESPEANNNDWLDPHYESFYQTRIPGLIQSTLDKLSYKKIQAWSPLYLSKIVKKATKQNQERGLKDGKHCFVHIKSLKPTTVFLFGDLHGAFHSALRDLLYLKKINVIDDNLKILDENHYVVFNGDAIDRSAYSIDTLILIVSLLLKNPDNVFYVAGSHERSSNWLDFSLKRELSIRGKRFSHQHIPFLKQVVDFFYTLPEAVYISGKDHRNGVIRIAFNEKHNLNYNEFLLDPAFLNTNMRVSFHHFKEKPASAKALDAWAAVKTEEWRKSNRIRHGLGLLDQDHGATTWAVLSSPILVHKLFLNFYDDAFARIDVNQEIENATIARVYSEAGGVTGFQEGKPVNIISAQDHLITHVNTIKVASTMSLVRGVPSMGQQAEIGLNLSINQYNRNAIDHGNNIRLYIDNDDYMPKFARANVLRYVDEGIKFLLLPIGSPTVLSYIDMVPKKDFAILFPISGSMDLRKADFHNIVHFRATYEDEVKALIAMLIKENSVLKFAFFYQDDSYGRGPFLAAVAELKRLGINNFVALPYTRGSVSFERQIQEIKKNQPDALGFFSTSTATQEFIRQLGVTYLANTQLFGISFVGELNLRRFAKRHGLNFMLGSCVPNPKVSQIPIAKSYRKAMDQINSNYDVFSFEAYIATNIFLKAIENLGQKPITPGNVIAALEAMKNINFEGLELNFNEKTRTLARKVWLESEENVEWKEFPVK